MCYHSYPLVSGSDDKCSLRLFIKVDLFLEFRSNRRCILFCLNFTQTNAQDISSGMLCILYIYFFSTHSCSSQFIMFTFVTYVIFTSNRILFQKEISHAGRVGLVMVLTGITGSLACGFCLDKTKQYRYVQCMWKNNV